MKTKSIRKLTAVLLLILNSYHPVCAGEIRARSTNLETQAMAITIYNSNLGLIKETRSTHLPTGAIQLDFMDVASLIKPETVHIQSKTEPDSLTVLEQNYEYDLLSPDKLLDKYIGKKIKVYRWNDVKGKDEVYDAEVLSTYGGTILKIGKEIVFNFPGRFSFPEVPENLISKPTLVWSLINQKKHQTLEVSYLTTGLTWHADYVLVLNDKDTAASFNGWVTLENTSGASYQNATLKLVAGDVNVIKQRYDQDYIMLEAGEQRAKSAPQFSEESFFEYHLYTLERPATLKHNEKKQISLMEVSDIIVDKKLIFFGQPYYYRTSYGQVLTNQKVGVYLDIQNKKEQGLGLPLPKGNVRVYKADSSGSLQFIGEDRIDHTPKDERIRIKMGDAFDVVGDRKQTDWKALGHCVSESTWEISLRNHKDEDIIIEVVEPIHGEWTILSSSHSWEKVDSKTFKFTVPVKKNSEVKIQYQVRVSWI